MAASLVGIVGRVDPDDVHAAGRKHSHTPDRRERETRASQTKRADGLAPTCRWHIIANSAPAAVAANCGAQSIGHRRPAACINKRLRADKTNTTRNNRTREMHAFATQDSEGYRHTLGKAAKAMERRNGTCNVVTSNNLANTCGNTPA